MEVEEAQQERELLKEDDERLIEGALMQYPERQNVVSGMLLWIVIVPLLFPKVVGENVTVARTESCDAIEPEEGIIVNVPVVDTLLITNAAHPRFLI